VYFCGLKWQLVDENSKAQAHNGSIIMGFVIDTVVGVSGGLPGIGQIEDAHQDGRNGYNAIKIQSGQWKVVNVNEQDTRNGTRSANTCIGGVVAMSEISRQTTQDQDQEVYTQENAPSRYRTEAGDV